LGMLSRRALAGLGLTLAATAVAAADAASGRRAEVLALQAFAEATHPRGREAAADPAWREAWSSLADRADGLSDGAYFVGLMRAIRWFRDGHSTILPFAFVGGVPAQMAGGAFGIELPLKARAFDDGVWVTAAGGDGGPLLGARIRAVNEVADAEIMRRIEAAWPAGNDAWPHRWAGHAFASPGLLQGLGVVEHPDLPIRYMFDPPGGHTSARDVTPRKGAAADLPALQRTPCGHETWARAAGRGNYLKVLPTGELYLSLDEMADQDGKTFLALTADVFEAMKAPKSRRLIIDLRRNGGGDNFLGEALRKHIGRSRFNRPGGLYVLISPQTFSAAQNLANRLERETFAIFVGGPSGGAPNHYGDAKLLRGTATGVTAMVSTLPWFDSYPSDKRVWILPDLPVADRFEDWRAGRDPVLAAALAHAGGGPDNDLTADRVFYSGRASQKGDWKPFWRS
jgi:hypothetical protein